VCGRPKPDALIEQLAHRSQGRRPHTAVQPVQRLLAHQPERLLLKSHAPV
jgi:hypothetical protein